MSDVEEFWGKDDGSFGSKLDDNGDNRGDVCLLAGVVLRRELEFKSELE